MKQNTQLISKVRRLYLKVQKVKFYYGNKDIVVDNETNLAERDKILLTIIEWRC